MCKEGLFHRVTTRVVTAVCAFVFIGAAQAANVTLSWDASASPDVTGYNLYFGRVSHVYTNMVPAGTSTTVTVSNLTPGITYFFAATAYDSFGIESDYSTETNYSAAVAGNTPPTISAISDQITAQDTATTAIPFTVGDAESAASSLSVSGASSDTSIIAQSGIAFGGSGANRTVRLTPVTGQSGSANITVTVSDGSASAVRTFQVTVVGSRPVNTPPSISSIGDQTIDFNATSDPIPFTVSDSETAASSLTVSAVSSNSALVVATNIVFDGSGNSRTFTITPVANRTGTARITIVVDDGAASSSNTFNLTVTGEHVLVLSAEGNGSVSGTLGTNKLVAGHTYTLTATPDAGQQFIGWKGSIKSSNPKLTFVAKKDMDLEADFAPGNFTPDNNTYYGLFYETDKVEQNSSGALSIRSTSRGTYTGKVQMSGHSYGFSGKYDGQGAATNNVMRGIQRPLTLVFHFGVGAQADQVYGTVADGTWLAVLSGERAAFNRLNPAPFAGNYTLIIPGQSGDKSVPAGDGFGAIRVTTSGGAVFSGSLADGTKVTQSAGLAKDGSWPFYASMYAGNGSLVSWLTISKQPDATPDITGLMSWIKQSGSPSKAYLSGFTTEAHAVGAVYARPSNPSQHIIGLNSAEIAFTDGDLLDAPFTNSITLGQNSRVANSSANRLVMSFNLANGLFKGTVANPSGATMPFCGAVFQKANAGFGYALGSSQSSLVTVGE